MEIRIFGLADDSIVDGPGVRYTVFVQGCPHHCPGCHNPASHDFAGGTLMDTDGIIRKIGENPLLDGVSAMRMRLEMGSYTEIRTQIGMLEINFCANGRFETRFSLRDHVLLKPGDMAISCYDGVHGTMSESHFPLGYYEGICLEVDPAAAQRWIERNAPVFSGC